MIVLLSDFGLEGPYIGQVKAVLQRRAPGLPVIDLFSDLPPFRPQPAAYLLAAYAAAFPPGCVFLAVVDPGVGSARAALAAKIGQQWYVGPDNGLFAIAARRAASVGAWTIAADPARLSASFHGRDLFAPVAAEIALTGAPPAAGQATDAALGPQGVGVDWPDELAEIVYIDRFGNAITGLRAATLSRRAVLRLGGSELRFARTFSAVAPGRAFWYENANGLVEIAANQSSAAASLGFRVGQAIALQDDPS